MIVLVKLLLAHFLGDFLLQPNKWVVEKKILKAKSSKLYIHLLIHGLLVFFLLDCKQWILALLITIVHGIIDTIKLYAQKENNETRWFLIDQFLHIISTLILWLFFYKPQINFNFWYENITLWTYSTALLFITIVSGIVMRELMAKWSNALHLSSDESLQNAGKYIGILERLFVFLFVVTDNWEGIGFLLATKSIFRFGDLKESKDRKLTEYILIGTLLSFGIAIITGMLVLNIIQNYN